MPEKRSQEVRAMREEHYKDQFTPWKPNHLVDDDITISADFMAGAAHLQYGIGDTTNASMTTIMLTSALIVNFYLDHMQMLTGGKKDA